MSAKLGLNANVYRLTTGSRADWGTNGTGAAPSNLSAIGLVRDVTLNMEKAEANVGTRGNGGWEASLGTLKKASVDLTIIYDPSDAGVAALLSAFTGNTMIVLAVLDGDKATAGVRGLYADFEVLKVERAEPIEGEQALTVTVKPGLGSLAPQFITVA